MINFFKLSALISLSLLLTGWKNINSLALFAFFLTIFVISLSGFVKFRQRVFPLLLISIVVLIINLVSVNNLNFNEKLLRGIFSSLKIFSLSLIVLFYTSTTSPAGIIEGLFFLPKRIRFALALSLTLIPVLLAEYRLIRLIQLTRGMKKSVINPLADLIPVAVPLLHRTMQRATRLGMVMHSRGYV